MEGKREIRSWRACFFWALVEGVGVSVRMAVCCEEFVSWAGWEES